MAALPTTNSLAFAECKVCILYSIHTLALALGMTVFKLSVSVTC